MKSTFPAPGAAPTTTDNRGRRALTHVPLSDTALPPLDPATPPWPAGTMRAGGMELCVRRTPGSDQACAVYVHGLGGSSTNWTDLAAQLTPFASGVAPDLPGFGFSEPSAGFDFSIARQVDVLAEFVRGLGAGPVHLLGNSMGGAVATVLAARRPELVRTLTLISPAVPDRRPDPRRLSDPRMALAYLPVVGKRARRELAALGPRERAKQVIDLCFADPSRFPDSRLDELAEEHGARADLAWATPALARSTFGIFRSWLTLGAGSLWASAAQVAAPTLVVWGTEDKVISVRRAVRTARTIPHARLLVLPRTGHVAQMERPVSVARAVLGLWETADRGQW